LATQRAGQFTGAVPHLHRRGNSRGRFHGEPHIQLRAIEPMRGAVLKLLLEVRRSLVSGESAPPNSTCPGWAPPTGPARRRFRMLFDEKSFSSREFEPAPRNDSGRGPALVASKSPELNRRRKNEGAGKFRIALLRRRERAMASKTPEDQPAAEWGGRAFSREPDGPRMIFSRISYNSGDSFPLHDLYSPSPSRRCPSHQLVDDEGLLIQIDRHGLGQAH